MTVKEVFGVIKASKDICLGYGDRSVQFDPTDDLLMDAYGSYVVDKIEVFEDGYVEVNIALRPVKAGA